MSHRMIWGLLLTLQGVLSLYSARDGVVSVSQKNFKSFVQQTQVGLTLSVLLEWDTKR
jgi:hypothetical protein